MQAKSFNPPSPAPASPVRPGGWLRRWWPVLVPAGFSLACAVVLAVQQQEIRTLKQQIERRPAKVAPVPAQPAGSAVAANGVPAPDPEAEAREIARLKELVGKLTGEIAGLQQLRSENSDLRAKIAAAQPGIPAEDLEALQKAKARAQMIQCVNNMKQLGLSVRLWAADHADQYPTDIVCMSNEMSTPRILICPGDQGHVVAPDFNSFTPAGNCSYEWFLSPPGSDAEPSRVLLRCPIHGNVGLYDGSVQMGAATNHPDWFVQRDGKLYYENPAKP